MWHVGHESCVIQTIFEICLSWQECSGHLQVCLSFGYCSAACCVQRKQEMHSYYKSQLQIKKQKEWRKKTKDKNDPANSGSAKGFVSSTSDVKKNVQFSSVGNFLIECSFHFSLSLISFNIRVIEWVSYKLQVTSTATVVIMMHLFDKKHRCLGRTFSWQLDVQCSLLPEIFWYPF